MAQQKQAAASPGAKQAAAEVANQTDSEFFAVVATGRQGVQQALDTMHDELMAVASAPVRAQGDTWKARALAYVAGEPKLAEVLAHRRGVWSVYQSLAKMAQMGLQPGGQFPHAYLVPYAPSKGAPKIAQPVVTAEGYKFAVLHGPQPVARDVTYAPVRDGDEIAIDQAAGQVRHTVNPLAERGQVLGVWVRVVPINGSPQVQWYSRKDLLAVRDTRSLSWQYNADKSPWKTDEEAMLVKTAVKRALKPWAAEAEGLAMMYAEDDAPRAEAPRSLDARDVTDRAHSVLDSAMASMIADPVEPLEDDADDNPEEKPAGFDAPEDQPAGAPAEGDQDLF